MNEPPFDKYLHAVRTRAEAEARASGSATIEANHLLLAVATQEHTAARRILEASGLDYQALKEAFHREFVASLEVAGVALDTFDLPQPTPDPSRRPRPGAFFRVTMERTMASRRMREPGPGSSHLLLGILDAEVGTVPRALSMAGVNRVKLIERVRRELQPVPASG